MAQVFKHSYATKIKRIVGVTSALNSTYRLVQKELHVGDTAHFIIQAKDSKGRHQVTGGDFWFPVLTSDIGAYPVKGGRTAGRVVDHNNGTYSVFFYLGWEGITYVHMTLASPSDATKWLREKYWPTEKRVLWAGTFTANDTSVFEESVCFILRNVTSRDLCVIGHNQKAMGLTALYCQKPQTFTCDDFGTLSVHGKLTDRRTKQLLRGNIKLFVG